MSRVENMERTSRALVVVGVLLVAVAALSAVLGGAEKGSTTLDAPLVVALALGVGLLAAGLVVRYLKR